MKVGDLKERSMRCRSQAEIHFRGTDILLYWTRRAGSENEIQIQTGL